MANFGNDHEFISKEYISIGMRPLGVTKSKTMRAYAQSGQYIPLWRVVVPNSQGVRERYKEQMTGIPCTRSYGVSRFKTHTNLHLHYKSV